jgi:dienelactone hydrolase
VSTVRGVDTISTRWARLQSGVQVFGPDDDLPRPAVLLFHGCGGVRSHLARYAKAAAELGVRAFIIDSYAPRGWGREVAISYVCSGAGFRGNARAGDVLASLWGVSRRADVDASRICLAGWSHGGWSIMELMSAQLTEGNEIGLADARFGDLSGVRSTFLAYPYIGFLATRRMAPWLRRPQTLAVIATSDYLTSVGNARRTWDAVTSSGVPVERWFAQADHSFDEPLDFPPMRHHAAMTAESLARFGDFLVETLLDQRQPTRAEA